MRFRAPALLLLAALAPLRLTAQCHFRTTHQPTATYRLQTVDTPYGLYLHVTLSFRVDSSGSQSLLLPISWAGESGDRIQNLRADTASAKLTPLQGAIEVVTAKPSSSVTISYDLIRDWTGPLRAPQQFRPVLMPTYLQLTGSNSLVELKLSPNSTETANFDWTGLPPSWSLATSFGASSSDHAKSRCQSYTGTSERIDESLFAAGDYRILPFSIGDRPAILAVRSTWSFTDAEAIADIQKVVGNVRAFWHDDNFPYFLVTLSPFDQDHGSSDGSAFTNAFWMYISRKDSLSTLLPQLAHESFHAWNPLRMGPDLDDGAGITIKWFKEGGTEYYAQLLTWRAGELSTTKYIDGINKDLRAFPNSKSEYIRGRVISLWLDATIRAESHNTHSLDDVMFDMVHTAPRPFTAARILATADKYLSHDSQAKLEAAALHNADLPAPEQIPYLAGCTDRSQQTISPFDLGFDFDQSQKKHKVVDVDPTSPAYAAGLRDGQPLTGWSIYNGDTTRPAKMRIRNAEDKAQEIVYVPLGKPVPTWAYHLKPDQSCSAISSPTAPGR